MSTRKTYTYDARLGRYRDPSGRIVSAKIARRSSAARAQFDAATAPTARRAAPGKARGKARGPVYVPPYSFDPATGFFVDSLGQHVPRTIAWRSSRARVQYHEWIAREEYERRLQDEAERILAARPKLRKEKIKLKRQRKPRAIPTPFISEASKIYSGRHMMLVSGLEKFTVLDLAKMLLIQIEAGAADFRFFWKPSEALSANYPAKIASTSYIRKSVITPNTDLQEIVKFLKGRGNRIKGKVMNYIFV